MQYLCTRCHRAAEDQCCKVFAITWARSTYTIGRVVTQGWLSDAYLLASSYKTQCYSRPRPGKVGSIEEELAIVCRQGVFHLSLCMRLLMFWLVVCNKRSQEIKGTF